MARFANKGVTRWKYKGLDGLAVMALWSSEARWPAVGVGNEDVGASWGRRARELLLVVESSYSLLVELELVECRV